ncbi:hypothetical protein TOI97_10360 [Denitrificimonas sp. JX-1]|uniref:Uncharacterized protein n=1 Tax=Denitrificimonas halotolerans TaxID=3098930 RepID=A0ABU5GSK7_9GAMM|nr:hypothetical protein [Denitrificimonas sp. JX-1]MDY7219963.1 hypothetical protein [Denitrificimonas sp. JX-1]
MKQRVGESEDKAQDDSRIYEQTHMNQQIDDPLVAIRQMRLEQLAVCHIKSHDEMQAMREQHLKKEGEQAVEED